MNTAKVMHSIRAIARQEGWDAPTTAQRAEEFQGFVARVTNVSRGARKLLTLIAEQAPTEVEHEALMPRLHEACGLDPEEMDRYLHELGDANLIRIDGQYPFEQVAPAAEASGWAPMESLAVLAKQKGVILRDALGEMELGFVD